MQHFFDQSFIAALLLFAGMLLMDYFGLWVKIKRSKTDSDTRDGLGPIEGALLGLLALLLAFTFNLSAVRYDARRDVIVEEANDIGTVMLRVELYPDSIRRIMKPLLEEYLDARIDYYEAGTNETKVQEALNGSSKTSRLLFLVVAEAAQHPENNVRSMQMIPALNSMIDIVTTRDNKRLEHVPSSIIYLLFALCLLSAFIVGYGRKNKNIDGILIYCFALMVSITVYLILDLDQSRSGIITMDIAHSKMQELKYPVIVH